MLLLVFYQTEHGFPEPNQPGFLLALFVIVTPIVNLAYLFFSKPEDWFSRYFQRKAAKERKRNTELEAKKDS